MPHSLIIGMTTSGKTTLAKKMASDFKRNGFLSMALDPLRDPSWPCDFVTDDPQEFMNVALTSRNCALFIDESGETIGRFGGDMNKLATRIRHYGHRSIFITQRAQQLDKIVRDQCEFLFLFRVSRDDAKLMAAEYGHDELAEAYLLQRGEFYFAQRFAPVRKLNVFKDLS